MEADERHAIERIEQCKDERDFAVHELEQAIDRNQELQKMLDAANRFPDRKDVLAAMNSSGPGVRHFRNQGYTKRQAKALALFAKIRRRLAVI